MRITRRQSPEPLSLDLKDVLYEAAVDAARDLAKDRFRDSIKEPASQVLTYVLPELIGQATGIVGRLIITAVLKSVDDTRRRLKIVESDVRFLMWEPILSGAQIALQEINAPYNSDRIPFKDGRLQTALSRLGQAKQHYEYMGVSGGPLFDLDLLIAFVTLQITGGRADARDHFRKLANRLRDGLEIDDKALYSARETLEKTNRLMEIQREMRDAERKRRQLIDPFYKPGMLDSFVSPWRTDSELANYKNAVENSETLPESIRKVEATIALLDALAQSG